MLFVLFLTALLYTSTARVIYINVNSPPGGDGSSWPKAFRDLQDGLTAAGDAVGTQIWVTTGTYKPSVLNGDGQGIEPNLATFKLSNNNALYGGFRGNERSLNQRNPSIYPTVLSGALVASSNKQGNAWHILTADGVSNVVVDGFIVQDGYAAGPDLGVVTIDATGVNTILSVDYVHDLGAGLLVRHGASVVLNNMIFRNNEANCSRSTMITLTPPPFSMVGGGAAIGIIEGSSVTITSSTFSGNLNTMIGTDGAINVLMRSNLTVVGSTFSDNVGRSDGGAIHCRNCDTVTVSGSTFVNNIVLADPNAGALGQSGGAISVFRGHLTVSGSTFTGNRINANTGCGGIFFHTPFDDGHPYQLLLSGSVFYNNTGTLFGGAVTVFGFLSNPGVKAQVTSCLFNANTAAIGAALYIDSLPTTVSSCLFNGNVAGTAGAVFAGNFGDQIMNFTSLAMRKKVVITGSSFTKNIIANYGQYGVVATFSALSSVLAQLLYQPPADVTAVGTGGAAVAVQFGGNVEVSSSVFSNNNAAPGVGGAFLIGGSVGMSGGTPLGMNQAALSVKTSYAMNSDVAVLDPKGLGSGADGVSFITDGSVV